MQSVFNELKAVAEKSEPGTLLFPEDFAAIGILDAIRAVLVRLCRSGVIMRAAQGIYYHPKVDTKWGSGIIPPTIEEIAEGIAKRDKVRIAPTGAYCLNLLGLSTQIPANVVFVTDGSGRRVNIGKGKGILFKHTSEMRTFAFHSEMMLLIVMPLREIGENNIMQEQLPILKQHLAATQQEDFQADIKLAISQILGLIESKDIAIPEIQRPFVWRRSQVRDLMDSLLSHIPVGELVNLGGDIHHIFPKQYLVDNGYDKNQYNQVANYAYLDTPINIKIGKKAPKVYLNEALDAIKSAEDTSFKSIKSEEELLCNLEDNCIPADILEMDYTRYAEFLEARRSKMTALIKQFYYSL